MHISTGQVIIPPILSAVLNFGYLSGPSTVNLASSNTDTLDVLEVIKVYGRLAGPECYGRVAPFGSSCQITESDLKRTLLRQDDSISRDLFEKRLVESQFQWPLKPYGVEKSNDKTALMNKGAETRLYMDELQAAGLYDARNPTGPLPTSLRPQLNTILQKQGLQTETVDRVYSLILQNSKGKEDITKSKLDAFLAQNGGVLDYYDFIRLLGPDTVSWR